KSHIVQEGGDEETAGVRESRGGRERAGTRLKDVLVVSGLAGQSQARIKENIAPDKGVDVEMEVMRVHVAEFPLNQFTQVDLDDIRVTMGAGSIVHDAQCRAGNGGAYGAGVNQYRFRSLVVCVQNAQWTPLSTGGIDEEIGLHRQPTRHAAEGD